MYLFLGREFCDRPLAPTQYVMEVWVDVELIDSLKLLAEQNKSGMAFLAAYGATWIVCGVLWLRKTEKFASIATIFQGQVAFPVAIGLSVLIGAIGRDRPVGDEVTQLSVLIGTSQLLGLPFLIYLFVKEQYHLVPFGFAAITSMHFVMYTWLYQTPVYFIMAVLISLGSMTLMFLAPKDNRRAAPSRVCFLTGGLLLAAALFFFLLHL